MFLSSFALEHTRNQVAVPVHFAPTDRADAGMPAIRGVAVRTAENMGRVFGYFAVPDTVAVDYTLNPLAGFEGAAAHRAGFHRITDRNRGGVPNLQILLRSGGSDVRAPYRREQNRHNYYRADSEQDISEHGCSAL